MANDEAKNMDMAAEEMELDDSQLEQLAGGAYDEQTGECRCNGCGTLMDFKGKDSRGVKTFKCPNCGRGAHVYY